MPTDRRSNPTWCGALLIGENAIMAKMNQIQFQAGMSLDQFLDRYGDQEKCELALEKSRWPQGFECPHCGAEAHYVVWHGKVKTFQCCACRHQST
jgi:hypothetical protein